MKINEMQLNAALTKYIDKEILPLSGNMQPLEQFVFGIKIGVIKSKMKDAIHEYIHSPAMKTIGLIGDDGLIDVDPIYHSAVETLRKMGQIDIGGIVFKESDLEMLYNILQNHQA